MRKKRTSMNTLLNGVNGNIPSVLFWDWSTGSSLSALSSSPSTSPSPSSSPSPSLSHSPLRSLSPSTSPSFNNQHLKKHGVLWNLCNCYRHHLLSFTTAILSILALNHIILKLYMYICKRNGYPGSNPIKHFKMILYTINENIYGTRK